MGAIGKSWALVTEQPQVGFVDQSRGLQRMIRTFAQQDDFSQSVQFAINHRQKLINSARLPASHAIEQRGDGRRVGHQRIFATPSVVSGTPRVRASLRSSSISATGFLESLFTLIACT